MLKNLLAAALVAGGVSSAAVAGTLRITFETANGTPYCSHLLLHIDGNIAHGRWQYPQACGGYLGNFALGLSSDGFNPAGLDFGNFVITPNTIIWSVTTPDGAQNGAGYVLIYNLDFADGTYEEGFFGNGTSFSFIDAGRLVVHEEKGIATPSGGGSP
jgi:hypothetical protein